MNTNTLLPPHRRDRFSVGAIALAPALLLAFLVPGAPAEPDPPPARSANNPMPTVFLIGDSTVKNGTKGQVGWGQVIASSFDLSRIAVTNRALGGRSSRTYLTEGLWTKVLAEIKPGDFVLMQFGHNDGGPLGEGRARASLKGVGDETQDVLNQAGGTNETVHTYGWYLRKYISDTKAKGATPIVLSLVPRNIWKEGKVARAANDYGKWAGESAKSSQALFIDLNEIVAQRYETAGQEKVQQDYFGATDHTHTTRAGAEVNAACVVDGIRKLKDCRLRDYLVTGTSPNVKE